MERSEIVYRAAAQLRVNVCGEDTADIPAGPLIGRLCAALELDITATPGDGTMLGGAYARLQMWDADVPMEGGIIWVRDDLPPERRAFAVAHELGHFVLHRGERVALHAECDAAQVNEAADAADLRTEDHRVEEYSKHARRELEANSFAAELLAPRVIVRRLFASERGMDAAGLAVHFGISETLARRRLLDAVLAPPIPAAPTLSVGEGAAAHNSALELLEALDPFQRAAARAGGPALVVAGPGTGKTATLVGRVAHLVAERGYQPERVLALTFSNRAAGEMRERLIRAGLPGERMPVMTIHAFAATLLREYAKWVPHGADEPPLPADFRILDAADSFLLMEDLLAELPLRYYRSLGNPTLYLRTLLNDFSQARDALLTPEQYLALVEAMPELPDGDGKRHGAGRGRHVEGAASEEPAEPAGYTREQIAKARERALAYGVWDRALRRRGIVDFGGLIQRAVELLRTNDTVLADVRRRYAQVLVDEFQDTNRAAGELLLLVAGADGAGLWVVGDRNQSIYRWRGASPSNLERLAQRYPNLEVHTLRRCYRSVPAIVHLGSDVAARMAARQIAPATEAAEVGEATALARALAPVALEPVRGEVGQPPVLLGEGFTCDLHERAGLAEAIRRRHAAGIPYGEQAVLCRTHKQAAKIASALADEGITVGRIGGFFDRPEIKDALALLSLAAGPDARGVLRADALVAGLGFPPLAPRELAIALRILVREPLPVALAKLDALPEASVLSASARFALVGLGRTAKGIRNAPSLSGALSDYLLRPRGYAWRLLRAASGDATEASEMTPGEAQTTLAALGELLRLVGRFDLRWASDDEFRRRLIRAVRHVPGPRTPSAAQPDALEGAPVADVAEPARAANDTEAPDGTAPPVRCFLHYLHALRGAETEIVLPAGDEDAVHVLTLHASKGLEFPAVYLPGLAAGQFPSHNGQRDEVCPPGFRESDAPGERDAEERCLFYVGMTRARDVVAFTRAARYGKVASAAPSSLLALLDGASDFEAAPPLLPEAELAALPGAVPPEPAGSSESDEETEAAPSMPASAERQTTRTYTLHELEQYIACPRQYKYARDYGLLDPAEDAVHRFHRYLYRARRELREVAPGADWAEAERRLWALWETDGPAGHAYDAFYWRHARRMLRDEWQAMAGGAGSAALPGVIPADELSAELNRCVVRVTADRIPSGASGNGGTEPTTLARFHTGRPAESHKNDLALPLYYLAHQQRQPDDPARVELVYPIGSLDEAEREAAAGEAAGPVTVDVTAEARRAAESYIRPGRRARSKLDKLDEAAAGIEARQFPPKPDEARCAACAYCYVCPADPEAMVGNAPQSAVAVKDVHGLKARG